MSPQLYIYVFITITTVLAVGTGLRYIMSSGDTLLDRSGNVFWPAVICLALAIWLGMRPVSSVFGDTVNYAYQYMLMETGNVDVEYSFRSEWFWELIMRFCKDNGFSIHTVFTIVSVGYFMTAMWAVWIFMPKNPMLGMLFVLTSLMFYPFATNGLRNGLACHIMLLAIAFFFEDKYFWAALLAVIAFGTHRSIILPLGGVMAARYLLTDARFSLLIWLGAIIISLLFGETLTNWIAALGFDDRMTSYTANKDLSLFSSDGFRWDFVLYSSVPIMFGAYVLIYKQVEDRWYSALYTTYCLANAFWVIVIRTSYTNRFAYLSWFLYPLLVAYPFVQMRVWNEQDRAVGWVLIAYSLFTAFMLLIFM